MHTCIENHRETDSQAAGHMHTCIHEHTSVHAHMRACTHTHMPFYAPTCVCRHVFARSLSHSISFSVSVTITFFVSAHKHAHTSTHTHKYTHTHPPTRTHTHACIRKPPCARLQLRVLPTKLLERQERPLPISVSLSAMRSEQGRHFESSPGFTCR